MNDFSPEFFEQTVGRLSAPAERLLCALQWRGFLVEQHDSHLLLCPGSPTEDYRTLRDRIRLRIRRRPDAWQIPFRDNDISDSLLHRIFFLPTKLYGAGRELVGLGVQSFINTAYGGKLPAENLDAGIALLVKALPAVGVFTIYSCSGHGSDPAFIAVHSKWHLKWLQAVLQAHCRQSTRSDLWEWSRFEGLDQKKPRWNGLRWVIDLPEQSPEELWLLLHRFALDLFNPAFYKPVLSLRRTIRDSSSFDDAISRMDSLEIACSPPVKTVRKDLFEQ